MFNAGRKGEIVLPFLSFYSCFFMPLIEGRLGRKLYYQAKTLYEHGNCR